MIVEVQPSGSKAGTAGRSVQVMNLLYSAQTRNLANLSSPGAGNDSNRGSDRIDWIWGGAGDDILNPGDNDDQYDAVLGSTGNDRIVYTDSGPSAYQALGYFALETGIRATINGITNVATVDKGDDGTDTIVDIKNPLDATRNPPIGGFGIIGTDSDDRFDLTLADGQWMEVRGEAGNDTIHIISGRVILNFRHTTNGLDVDLGAGLVNDDGFGGVDTIIGDVFQLEAGPGDNTLLGSSIGDRILGEAGDDTINPGASSCNNQGTQDHVFGSIGDDTIVYSEVGAAGCNTLYYNIPWPRRPPLSEGQGIDVTINGITNRGTVRKGADGTDTLVDIATQLNATMSSPYGYFALYGSFSDDVFDLTIGDGQSMGVRGLAGDDTFHLSGSIRIDYSGAPEGIDVDLEAGTASEDGYGGVDTFRTAVKNLRGSDHSDVIKGSGNDETFIGRGGDDDIDGRGGYDQLSFDRSGVARVDVDLAAGTATGTWNGMAFTYRISNIERIDGSRDGDDNLIGGGGNDDLRGRGGSDYLEGGAGNDRLEGGDGDDYFLFGPRARGRQDYRLLERRCHPHRRPRAHHESRGPRRRGRHGLGRHPDRPHELRWRHDRARELRPEPSRSGRFPDLTARPPPRPECRARRYRIG